MLRITHTKQQVKDPNAPQIEEGAGAVASDSLAAESTRKGGDFSENKNSEPLGVSGSNSTLANTDTSAAIKLDPARDAEAREANNKARVSSSSSTENKEGFKAPGTTGGASDSHAGTAPSYVNSQYVDHGKPKGKNLTEDAELHGNNASFNNEIGTKNDPGRLAEEKFAQQNAEREGGSAGMPKQAGYGDENPYGTFKGDSSA